MPKRKTSEIPTAETNSQHVLRDITLILSAMIVTGFVSYHLLVHIVLEPDKAFDSSRVSYAGGYYTRSGFHSCGTSPKTWREACQFFAPIIGFTLPLGVLHLMQRRASRNFGQKKPPAG